MVDQPKPIRVLLVEDNPGDARLIERALADSGGAGFELVHAASFQSGEAQLTAGEIDVVLLDLGLPGSSGFDTMTKVVAASPGTPLIVLTGSDEAQLVLECIKAGAKDYFVKSRMDWSRMIDALRRAASGRRDSANPAAS
jgi:DNA-binding NarL/FixJ family response regulator